MKRAVSLITIAVILGVSATVWIFAQVAAQAVFQQGRIDAFTFFIPYPAEDLDNEFQGW